MTLFCRVVELGSFAAAAQDQNVSPAIVGRHVADLEGMLNLRLINRTTRSMEVTGAGQRYYQGCKAMLGNLDALEHEVTAEEGREPTGVIRLASAEGLGTPLLLDAIDSFQEQYPSVLFDLVLENTQTDFVSSDVDLAIRLAITLEDSSLIVRKLAQTRLCLYAAPSYLQAHGTPKTLSDLAAHACLAFGASRFGDSWPVVTASGIRKHRQPWRLVVNQTQLYRDALARGMGIGLMPAIMATGLLAKNAVQPVNLDAKFPDVGVFAVYPSRAFQPRRVRMFLDHLYKRFAGQSGHY